MAASGLSANAAGQILDDHGPSLRAALQASGGSLRL
jgi:hypothetical protein